MGSMGLTLFAAKKKGMSRANAEGGKGSLLCDLTPGSELT